MTNKHTPGPWTCAPMGYFAHDYRLGIPGGQMPFVRGNGVEYVNARLIAATPDLLDALKIAAIALDLAALVHGDEYWQQEGRAAARTARLAIHKATGESS